MQTVNNPNNIMYNINNSNNIMYNVKNAELLKINVTEEQPMKRPTCTSWLCYNDLSSSVMFLVTALNMFFFTFLLLKNYFYSKELFN